MKKCLAILALALSSLLAPFTASVAYADDVSGSDDSSSCRHCNSRDDGSSDSNEEGGDADDDASEDGEAGDHGEF